MRAAVLVCELRDAGRLMAKAFGSSTEAEDLARKVRASGYLGDDLVRAGLVMHSERPLPTMKFTCPLPAASAAPTGGVAVAEPASNPFRKRGK